MRTTWGSSRRETGIGSGRKLLLLALVTVTAISVDPGATLASASSSAGRFTGQVARVMTRNVYLGADLGPAIRAPDLNSFVEATGAVLRQTTATNFPTRANGLAAEILGTQPDLVGLQEVALWRTGPSSIAPLLGGAKTATTVRYDFLQLLLDQLNAGEEQYLPVVVGVRVSQTQGGHFQHLLTLPILGQPVTVTRGWTMVDARVRGGLPFRLVNTHLEAFDPRVVHPSIRAQQAAELVATGGPATGERPVILLGDLNSDDDTVVLDDQQAYQVLLGAGLIERSTGDPLSCCISSYDLTTGTVDEFDHQVDHIMTDAPDTVRLVGSTVTGRSMVNGYWDSDHAGVFSALLIR